MFAQLRTVGYHGLTMGAVATAAGTGKAALYRRWCTKEDLVADALRHGLPSPQAVPPQQTVRDDLIALLRGLRDALAMASGAAFEAGPHEIVQDTAVEPCQRLILDALRRGAERGEVRPAAVTERVAAVGPAMVIHHVLTNGAPLDDEALTGLVDDVLLHML